LRPEPTIRRYPHGIKIQLRRIGFVEEKGRRRPFAADLEEFDEYYAKQK